MASNSKIEKPATKKDVKEIITEVVSASASQLRKEITEVVSASASQLRKEITEVVSGSSQEILGAMEQEFDEVKSDIKGLRTTTNRVENKLDTNTVQMDDHENRLTHLEKKTI